MHFEHLPTIPLPEEIEKSCINKIGKVSLKIKTRSKVKREKLYAIKKLDLVASTISAIFQSAYNNCSPLLALDGFYRELVDLLVDLNKLNESLIRIKKSRKILINIHKSYREKIRLSESSNEISSNLKEGLGRLISVIHRNKKYLIYLRKTKNKLSKLPDIDTEIPTIVIAGPPNVGKSSLVNSISSAKSEIAYYPFTTKSISIGHINYNEIKFQVIDTPGLLDRPLSERNKIELQAILALKYLAKMIVFIFDPSDESYYDINNQFNILKEIISNFNVPIVCVVNKIDIANKEKLDEIREKVSSLGLNLFYVSVLKGTNVEKLKEELISRIAKSCGLIS